MSVGYDSTAVRVRLNRGDGTFDDGSTYPVPSYPSELGASDFDGDADLDLMVVSAPGVSVLANAGEGSFGSATALEASEAILRLAIADLNADGRLDITLLARSSQLAVRLDEGSLGFAGAQPYGVGPRPSAIAALDLNGAAEPIWQSRTAAATTSVCC